MSNIANSFEIEIDYEDDDLREQIEEESTQALGWIRHIRAGDTVLVGGDDPSGMREYLTSFFGGVLQCLTAALSGERSHFTTGNGPIYVVLEPENNEAIRFLFAYKQESIGSPESREPFEPSAVVRVDPLVTEVLDSANEFLAHIAEWNPELAESSPDFRGIREDIEALEQAYRD